MKKIINDFLKVSNLVLTNPIYRPVKGFVSWNSVWNYKITLDCIHNCYSISYDWVAVIEENTYEKFIVKVQAKLQTLSTVDVLNSWY